MTKNRDVFFVDPTTYAIPNNGVAKVIDPRTDEEWAVLRYELSNFVCEGEYYRGLELILSTYLTHLSREEQPAVWISGFYGSGKSHFARVLEYLWRDTVFPEGAKARNLVNLPQDILDLLVELTTVGKREGGLWSAAGTLGAGAGNSARLALLSILFRSAGLPEQYAPARFVVWLKQNGFYEDVRVEIERSGKNFLRELNSMYVSPVVTEGLLKTYPGFASSPAEARQSLRAQYPPDREDISDDEMLLTMEEVLELQSSTPGKLPCTLLVFDELQQFIGQDSNRTFQVQNIVEACSSRFGNRLLFVATGQAAIQATSQLQKLQGRFTVQMMLTDNDVERVVREVVLRKKPAQLAPLQAVLRTASGEIDRHLVGTKIAPSSVDSAKLVPDYPLLPVRSRFWERFLRVVDSSGTVGQLRTQLRIVHEAIKEIADENIGTVVAGDVIYKQLKTNMLQSGMLLREMDTMIAQQDDGTLDGKLRARLCATVFLIGKLPTEGITATGVRADASTLADLLVEGLIAGSASLRQRIPALLQDLLASGTLIQVGDEYRMQTRESQEWEADYRRRYARIQADDSRIASDRTTTFRAAMAAALKGISPIQGASKTARKLDIHFGPDAPPQNTGHVPLWIRDEWSVPEKTIREDAQAAGIDSPVVFAFLPYQSADAFKEALVSYAAAKDCLASRIASTSDEGQEARLAMESRRQIEQDKRDVLIKNIVENARVYQGGGNEVVAGTFQASVRTAIEAALERLFPQFKMVDHPSWGTVVKRAIEGASDALSVVGYAGDIDKHPACQEIRTFIGGLGKKGSDIRKHFMGVGYGWPQDAVDGALLCLVAGGFVRAVKNSQPLSVKQITVQQIGSIDFYSEGITVSAIQRVGIRKLASDIGLSVKQGEEAEAVLRMLAHLMTLAATAGGDAPLPERPPTAPLEQLQAMSGNEQLVAVYERRDELFTNFKTWTQTREKIEERRPEWDTLRHLLAHARGLSIATEVAPQVKAIEDARALLHDPDPVAPLISKLATNLRAILTANHQHWIGARDQAMRTLENSEEWQRLDEANRQRMLSQYGLRDIPTLDIGTEEELLSALDVNPLVSWEDKIVAPSARVMKVREETVKLLSPQAVQVTPRAATLNSVEDVDAYLTAFRAAIMEHLEAGHPVII